MATNIAANNNVKFLLGLSTSLPTKGAEQGAFYLTTDENRLYIGNGETPVLLNEQVKFVESEANLPSTGKPEQLVFVRSGSKLCAWDSTANSGAGAYVQINPDTYFNGLDVSVGAISDKGSIITITGTDSSNHTKSDTFTIKGGAGIGLTASGDVLTIASTGSGGTKVNIAAAQATGDAKTAVITQTVTDVDAEGNEDTENAKTETITIKAGENMEEATVSGTSTAGVITLKAAEQGVKGVAVTNETSGFKIAISQSATGTGFGQQSATFDPTIKIDNNGTEETVNFVSGNADLKKLASKNYVAAEILKHEKNIDALQFKGVVSTSSTAEGTAENLPAINSGKVKVGYVYKVKDVDDALKKATGENNLKAGDLIIATEDTNYTENDAGYITAGGKYEVIPSGDELTYTMTRDNTAINLAGSDNTSYGKINFAAGTDLTATGTQVGDDKVETITFAHATKSARTEEKAATGTTVKVGTGETATIKVVTDVTADSTGHLSKINTQDLTIQDTGLKAVSVTATAVNSSKGVTLKTEVQDTNNTTKNSETSITFDTLTFAVSNNATTINMVWGTF